MSRKRVAILISGRGSNMAALIEAAKAPDYPAEIVLVLSNIADAGGLARAREAGIATEVVEHQPFGKDREAFDRAVHAVLDKHRIDIVCLAGSKQHGATVHYVVPELDSGPVIAQESVAVRSDDTAETLAARVLAVEHRIYPRALRCVAESIAT